MEALSRELIVTALTRAPPPPKRRWADEVDRRARLRAKLRYRAHAAHAGGAHDARAFGALGRTLLAVAIRSKRDADAVTDAPPTLADVLDAFERATGQSIAREVGPRRPGDIEQTYASCDKVERVLGWRATRTIDEAMRDAWRWQERLAKR